MIIAKKLQKDTLEKEIRTLMPNLQLEYIVKNWKSESCKRQQTPPIIAKSNDWDFIEIKKEAIKAKSLLYVSQMFSPALTIREIKPC